MKLLIGLVLLGVGAWLARDAPLAIGFLLAAGSFLGDWHQNVMEERAWHE